MARAISAARHHHDRPYTERQSAIDHMVTVHLLSPTHFSNMDQVEVLAEHLKEHAEREDAAYNHPSHYGGEDNPYEAIKVIEAWELDFCLGNTVKYISRAGKKDADKEIEDLKKARWYLDRRIQQLSG